MNSISYYSLVVFAKSRCGIQPKSFRSFHNSLTPLKRVSVSLSLQKNCSFLKPINLKNDFRSIFKRIGLCGDVLKHQKRLYHSNFNIKPATWTSITWFNRPCRFCFRSTIRKICLSSKYHQRVGHYPKQTNSNTTTVLYFASMLVFMLGVSYAAVPLYRLFCQATGIGGDPNIGHKIDIVGTMEPIRQRQINVAFNADHHAKIQWNFKPSQKEITVVPGETALAFYTAKNPTNEPIVGIATYNVIPFQAGLYFNKIQCFCFEEQWLNPNEEVDMPVFFYIDPDYDDDPALADVNDIILSYTFFKAEEGQELPLPGFMKANSVINLNESPKVE